MTVVEHERVARPSRDAPTTPRVTEADVLHRAADLLEEFGWCQGALGSKEAGGMCLSGAICAATEDFGLPIDGPDTLWDSAFRVVQDSKSSYELITWNDEPGRTKAEVVAALREAARRASPEGRAT